MTCSYRFWPRPNVPITNFIYLNSKVTALLILDAILVLKLEGSALRMSAKFDYVSTLTFTLLTSEIVRDLDIEGRYNHVRFSKIGHTVMLPRTTYREDIMCYVGSWSTHFHSHKQHSARLVSSILVPTINYISIYKSTTNIYIWTSIATPVLQHYATESNSSVPGVQPQYPELSSWSQTSMPEKPSSLDVRPLVSGNSKIQGMR